MRNGRSNIAAVTSMALAIVLATSGAVQVTAQEVAVSPDDAALQAMRVKNARIQLANYPRGALRRGEQGIVGISVMTDRQGRLRECAVSKSSGSAALDAATCDFLINHAKIQSYLSPGGSGALTRQEGQVVWQLPAGIKPAIQTSSTPSLNNASLSTTAATKKICRAQAKTGSLIASQRVCLTKAEWQRQYVLAQDETKDMHPKFQPGN